jgi:hypothetical protein
MPPSGARPCDLPGRPVRIVGAGRGRFELQVDADVILERIGSG